mmetsp:Transcript_19922/g.29803  ORF Transcript_19922/g.29803 Transcript_19922/m.29803 type:complete len:1135 (+) Transcript_19922:73-3477(+)
MLRTLLLILHAFVLLTRVEANISFPPSTPFRIDELMSGPLDDAKCNVEAVNTANDVQLACILADLMDTTFFRLFPVDLNRECPFFNKAAPKAPESCSGEKKSSPFSVNQPQSLSLEEHASCSLDQTSVPRSFEIGDETDRVDESLSRREGKVIKKSQSGCEDESQPAFWLDMCDGIGVGGEQATVINLRKNPERWTGYNGSQVWEAIYKENFFHNSPPDSLRYEERVLYKLLSGMHTSINVHIALKYYPPMKGKRATWEPNPEQFVKRYADHPNRIKNLHFAFVVLLRAIRKAGPYIRNLDYRTDPHAAISASQGSGSHTRALVNRLLSTHLLTSCQKVFSAFDESLLFQSTRDSTPVGQLKVHFKNVFQNISSILDCVSCQKCKLHGKLALMGLGSALKTLLLPADMLNEEGLKQAEVVAMVNTLGKFSKAIQGARDLTALYEGKTGNLTKAVGNTQETTGAIDTTATLPKTISETVDIDVYHRADTAIGLVKAARQSGDISEKEEEEIIDSILAFDPRPLLLSSHYSAKPFVKHILRSLKRQPEISVSLLTSLSSWKSLETREKSQEFDAIVIGGGLSGLTAALTVLDAGGRVALIEKEGILGGNSAWASSGINSASDSDSEDSTYIFVQDTLRSGGGNAALVNALVNGSDSAVSWIEERLGITLNLRGQLGGHSFPRTRRSKGGMVGQEIVRRMTKVVSNYTSLSPSPLKLMTKTRATHFLRDENGAIIGVEYTSMNKDQMSKGRIRGRYVAIATGGYANDRGEDSLLYKSRPELRGIPTTNGRWATGDGIKMALEVGAAAVDLSKVQVHPTAFIDPKDKENHRKTLCAELLRGVGGILLTPEGARFVDELESRDVVVAAMRKYITDTTFGGFIILLTKEMGEIADKHVSHYLHKGLLTPFQSLQSVAKWANIKLKTLQSTLESYNAMSSGKVSPSFGKKYFHNTPINLNGQFLAGLVIPAVHYTMGGISIAPDASVLSSSGTPIAGLLAGGEVAGGIHGKNRLGGNALTECVVFGRRMGKRVVEGLTDTSSAELKDSYLKASHKQASASETQDKSRQNISREELEKHSSPEDCWVAIHGQVYDLTDFVSDHPAGPEAITDLAGTDGTSAFEAIHTKDMLDMFEPIGTYSS